MFQHSSVKHNVRNKCWPLPFYCSQFYFQFIILQVARQGNAAPDMTGYIDLISNFLNTYFLQTYREHQVFVIENIRLKVISRYIIELSFTDSQEM